MAKAQNPPGPRQVFKELIDRISFPTNPGGVVMFEYTSDFGMQGDTGGTIPGTPPLLDASFQFLPPLDWLSFSMFGGPFKIIPPGNTEKNTDVVNPWTPEMIKRYAQWEAQDPISITGTSPGTTGTVYFIDTANWQLVYDHQLRNRISNISTRDQAIATFQALAGHDPSGLITDPSLVEVQLEQAFINGVIQDIPNFPNPITFQIFAEAGWTYHTEDGSGSQELHGKRQTAVAALNLQLIRNALPVDNQGKKPATFTFSISIEGANESGGIDLAAYAFGKPKDTSTSLPTIPNNARLDMSGADERISASRPSGGSVTVVITFAKKDDDGTLHAPIVQFVSSTVQDGSHVIN